MKTIRLSEKKRIFRRLIVVCAIFLTALAAGYNLFYKDTNHSAANIEPSGQEVAQKKSVVWTCSMHPSIRLPNPGRCPICSMELIPLTEEKHTEHGQGDALSMRRITLSPAAEKVAEVEVVPAVRMPVTRKIRMSGKVDYDETRVANITSWVSGRIDKLFVDYTGAWVKEGQPMAVIYSPELYTAQAELIESVKAAGKIEAGRHSYAREAAQRTEKAARGKLRLLGISKKQIQAIAKSMKPTEHVTIQSPISGIVIEKSVKEGTYVKTGEPLYTVADFSHLWVVLDAYESDLAWVRVGASVDFVTESYPGRSFSGKVVYIDPMVNEKSRTVRVRLDVKNPGRLLKPGMFVRARYAAVLKKDYQGAVPLVIPDTAVLVTGKRAVVYVSVPGEPGTYEGREVVPGPRAENYYVIKSGLSEGEKVVVRGNFKIDSAMQIMARPSMMNSEGGAPAGGHIHEHGQGSPSSSKMESSEDKASPAPLPEEFSRQLYGLSQAFGMAAKSAVMGNVDEFRKASIYFRQVIQGIDAKSLNGHRAMMWKELSMFMVNDAVLGHEVKNQREMHKEFSFLRAHFERMQKAFFVDHAGHGKEAPTRKQVSASGKHAH